MKKLILAALLLCVALPVFAHDDPTPYPALSLARLSMSVRAENNWWRGRDSAVLQSFKYKHEVGIGIGAAYGVVPRFAITARSLYFMDSKLWNHAIGVNYQFFSGHEHAARRGM